MRNRLLILLPSVPRIEAVFCRIFVGAEQSPAPTISDMVCAFKSITTKQANQQENRLHRKLWQRSFYDHVIRNEQDYLETLKYIDENPVQWELDQFYY